MQRYFLILVLIIAILIFIAKRSKNKKTLGGSVDNLIKDRYYMKNSEYLNQLNPAVKSVFENLIADINKMGYQVVITSGYRSFQKQAELKKLDPRNAAPGYSSHNYGTALDFVLVKDGKMIQKNAPRADWVKTGVPELAIKKYGMRWGGDFPGYPDHVHFDLNGKYDTKKLYAAALKKYGSENKIIGNKLDLNSIV